MSSERVADATRMAFIEQVRAGIIRESRYGHKRVIEFDPEYTNAIGLIIDELFEKRGWMSEINHIGDKRMLIVYYEGCQVPIDVYGFFYPNKLH